MAESNQSIQRRALITGGGSGFGLGVARALVGQAARVAIGDIHAGRLQEASKSLGPEVLALELDVTSPASVRAAVDACNSEFGGLDTLVNCAGVIYITPLDEVSEEQWDLVLNVDLKGTFLCCQAAAPLLRESGRGRIVNIGSDASRLGFPLMHHYCAAKHGVIGLTKSLAGELAPYKVTVNCVCPVGAPDTNMGQGVLSWKIDAMDKTPEEVMAATASEVPLKRNATVEDIVNAVMFFLMDESEFLTGGAIDVDGGMMSTTPIHGVTE